MEKLSDSDILLKEITLVFGEKRYTVPVLRSRATAKWRQQFFEKTKEIAAAQIIETVQSPEALKDAVGNSILAALLKFPEMIPDLIFSYAPVMTNGEPMPQEQIMDEAWDFQYARAFQQIWQVAFAPFFGCLGTVNEMQASQMVQ